MSVVGSLDTNALLRYIVGDIPEQADAVERLLRQAGGQLAVADIAIIEVVFVLNLYYGMSRGEVAEALRMIMNLREINCNRNLFNAALTDFVEHPALSFEDCCLAQYAKLSGAVPLYTFDRKLANQSGYARLIESNC